MMINIRLVQSLQTTILADLERQHPFATERVGFVFTRIGAASGDTHLVLPVDYVPIPDHHYIDDTCAGATIDSQAIRGVMERVLNTGEGVLHVHQHTHFGQPYFSQIDRLNIPQMAKSFHHASPFALHGGLLFSYDDCASLIIVPGSNPIRLTTNVRISIIGYPLRFFGRK